MNHQTAAGLTYLFKLITNVHGVTKTLTQWAKERGMRPALISHRISCGWSEADAVLTPPRHRSNPKKTPDNI